MIEDLREIYQKNFMGLRENTKIISWQVNLNHMGSFLLLLFFNVCISLKEDYQMTYKRS